jgi:hypothetical protein
MHAMMLSLSATASMRTSSFAVAVKVWMSSITGSALRLGAAAALGQPSAFALASHEHDDERPARGAQWGSVGFPCYWCHPRMQHV